MQFENIKDTGQKPIYSIDQYEGAKKWCFAIVLNRACDNYEDNPQLFSESLLRFEEVNRRDWFDKDIRDLIKKADTEDQIEPKRKPNTPVNRRLHDIRNYFSHSRHQDDCLYFKNDDPMRCIMEAAYEKAKIHIKGRQTEQSDIPLPELFDANNKITSAGVLFLASFFVERGILHRLMGNIGGFKDNRGKYGLTHDIFTTYCLKDSYSIHASDPKVVLFRDIAGYLSLVACEYYPTYLSKIPKENAGEKSSDEEKYAERKTDKFILFALKYLEEFVLPSLKDDYLVDIGRIDIIREESKETEEKDEQYKPHPNQGKVKVVFDSINKELPYYINHNTVILRIQKNGVMAYSCKIGVNDLKYLLLLCLQGKTDKALDAIYNYLHSMQDPPEVVKIGATDKLFQGLPEFILKQSGIKVQDKNKEKAARIKYIRDKWEKKKSESADMELHRKGRDILRYVNWHCETPLGTEKYDQLLVLLVNKNFVVFGDELNQLKRTEIISKDILEKLSGFQTINTLHQKVCNLVLEELSSLEKNDPGKLAEHIGLVRKPAPENNPPPEYKEKVRRFVEQPMIYKGFLRDQFFVNKDQDGKKLKEQKTFAKLVEETLGQNADVPLGKDFYYVPNIEKDEKKNRFHKDNAVLYETLALDRLCAMMARKCLTQINKNLAEKSEEIDWRNEDGKDFIYLKLVKSDRPQETFKIRFKVNDFAKLYVMDDPDFLGGLMKHFFPQEHSIEYHKLYRNGIERYTDRQKDGIEAILRLEDSVIRQKGMKPKPAKNYISFSEIMAQTDYPEHDQKVLNKVRRAVLHYHLKFEPADYNRFVDIMKKNKFWDGERKNKESRGR